MSGNIDRSIPIPTCSFMGRSRIRNNIFIYGVAGFILENDLFKENNCFVDILKKIIFKKRNGIFVYLYIIILCQRFCIFTIFFLTFRSYSGFKNVFSQI